jgi:hypothetical protein
MSNTVWVTCGTYNAWDPRRGLQDATLAHWKSLGVEVVRQRGDTPEHQRGRYAEALTVQTEGFVTISDDDILLRPLTKRFLHKDPVYRWHDYVQSVFDRFPEVGYLGPWLKPCDGKPEPRELVKMSVCGGIRFIRQGALDPTDLLPAEGRGYDPQIARMLVARGWSCAKLPRLQAFHLGRGYSTVSEQAADYRAT